MELEGSYEELFNQALEAIDPAKPDAAIAQFRKLYARLAGLPAELRAKGARLTDIMVGAADQLVTLLRWKGDYSAGLEILDRLEALGIAAIKSALDIQRAYTLIDSGQAEKGLDLLRGRVMQRPQDATARLMLAQELTHLKQLPEAERILRRVAQDKTDKKIALQASLLLMNVYFARGDTEALVSTFTRAVNLDPGARNVADDLYDWLLRKGELDALEALVESDGNPQRVGLYLGRIAAARGDREEAKRRWRKTLEREPEKSWISAQSTIEILLHVDRTEEAMALLAQALNQGMGGIRTMVLMGIGLALKGELERAARGLALAAATQVQLRPRRTALSDDGWWLVELYISDENARANLRPFFDVPQLQAEPGAHTASEPPAPQPAAAELGKQGL